ncbi:hypothetical protein FRC19_002562, partial [Serendipita sp. 401]
MWPFGGSGTDSKESSSTDAMKPISREARVKCWDSRDAFFACLDAEKIASPSSNERGDRCAAQATAYEANCAKRL